jgi:ABC-type Fe3+/spermidine/putrescine transport system ATPase subunit
VISHPVTSLKLASRTAPSDPEPPAAGWRGVRLQGRPPSAFRPTAEGQPVPDGRPVLDDFSLELPARGRLTLLGPAGAGKTAALMLLAGFARPDSGAILLGGADTAGLPPHRRDLGVVFQDDTLLPHLTLAGNVGFPLAVRGLPRPQQLDRVGWALEAFALSGLGDRHPRDLTAGQQVRGALARAVVTRPRLLVLDDPCAGLDGPARAALLRDLGVVAEAIGAAVLLATPDPADALALGGQLAVLQDGVLCQHGPVQTVYDRPASATIARLLGEANLLAGTVEAVEGDIARVRLACGPTVEARTFAGPLPGRPCVVCVRPERIAVAAIEATDMGDRALPAETVSLDWRGDHVRLTLRLGADGGRPAALLVKRPAGAVLTGLTPGQNAAVAWQPHHALVLAREG